jgi:quercetin dioxygenase-like cupin family protein
MPDPLVVPPDQGHSIQGPAGGLLTFKARAEQTGGSLTAFENVIAPLDGPPLHTHRDEDESWYIIEGRLRFQLGDALHEAPRGTFVFVPKGTPHAFQNIGDTPARILVLFTPSGMERFFDEFAKLEAPIDPSAFATLGAPAGMQVLGPPLR